MYQHLCSLSSLPIENLVRGNKGLMWEGQNDAPSLTDKLGLGRLLHNMSTSEQWDNNAGVLGMVFEGAQQTEPIQDI